MLSPGSSDTLVKALKIAASVYERHQVLSNWLISLGVDPKTATEDACGMEHQISDESFQAMKKFIEEHTITCDKKEEKAAD